MHTLFSTLLWSADHTAPTHPPPKKTKHQAASTAAPAPSGPPPVRGGHLSLSSQALELGTTAKIRTSEEPCVVVAAAGAELLL